MKRVTVIHNPTAGDEEHSKKELIDLLEKHGFECRYLSTKKKEWKDADLETDTDLVVIAGGDGTVRKVTKQLLKNKLLDKTPPIGLLPLGTANNIAQALGIKDDTKKIVSSWLMSSVKKYDVGKITNVPDTDFFIESFGYGIFPYLMNKMKGEDEKNHSPQESMQIALDTLYEIIVSYEPRYCKLEVDGTDHSGNFLLAEVMNTKSIGPNLILSPLSDVGDGEFEVILIPENHKQKFTEYIFNKKKGGDDVYQFHTLKAKNITISWDGSHVHADDTVIKLPESAEVKLQVKEGLLDFLVSQDNSADKN